MYYVNTCAHCILHAMLKIHGLNVIKNIFNICGLAYIFYKDENVNENWIINVVQILF